MSIECPACRHALKLKAVKAGRYTPRCPHCGRTFALLATAEGDHFRYSVSPLPEKVAPAAVVPTGADRTVVGGDGGPTDFEVDVAAAGPEHLPAALGGYRLLEPLGRGGMGVVYLARQVSLDRLVALKVMSARWASDPAFLVRFTREAHAAARLVHHNLVQVYDFGIEGGVPYFSMEFVKGRTLAALVKEHGKLDVEEAVGYVLQAARGLAYAHSQGMVHRDVKPDNLLLNDFGVIKVADLGLVKMVGETETPLPAVGADLPAAALGSLPNVTRAGLTLGTPNFMAPEQGRDPSSVDARADVYSLGCSLYYLLTGRQPFKGQTAMEVLVKHLSETPVPPEQINALVPADVSAVVLKMMAKKPADRHADMNAIIGNLEQILGVRRAGNLGPTQAQADALEGLARRFNEVPAARLRGRVLLSFLAACVGLTLLGGVIQFRLAAGFVVLAIATLFFLFLIGGSAGRTHLYLKMRELLLGSGWADRLTWAAGVLLLAGLLSVLGLLKLLPGLCVLGGALAVAYHLAVARPLAAQRAGVIEEAQKLLKSLRLRGLAEEPLHQFVSVHGGQTWEEFFESLFGYEAMVQARRRWGRADGRPRPTHAAWRDPLLRWIDARQRARQEARERKQLQQAEAAEVPTREAPPTAVPVQVETPAAIPAAVPVVLPPALPMEAVASPVSARERESGGMGTAIGVLFGLLLGPKVRFLAGAALLAGCFLWMYQNDLVPSEEDDLSGFADKLQRAQPLNLLSGTPAALVSGFNAAGAGLLLVLSALTLSWRLVFFLLLAAGVALTGHLLGIPDVGPVKAPYVALVAAFALAEFGVVFNGASRGY